MAFTASIVSCSSKEMDSDMWNLYSGTHPDLHDSYMDPPERIMVHPSQSQKPSSTVSRSRCVSAKDKDCFEVYYGTQSILENPYTTSAVMAVERCCTFTIGDVKTTDFNSNIKLVGECASMPNSPSPKSKSKPVAKSNSSKEASPSKQLLSVPTVPVQPTRHLAMNSHDLRRNKSDSELSSLDEQDTQPVTRPRILSDSSAHRSERQCVCKCTCGYASGAKQGVSDCCTQGNSKYCHKSNGKTRHKSRSLKSILHSILS